MFQEIADIVPKEIVPGYRARFIHTEQMTIGFWEVDAGAVMPVHQHIHEQTSHVLEGEFELTIGDERKVLVPGVVGIVPSNVRHGGVAITACKLLDTFSPVRQDYQ